MPLALGIHRKKQPIMPTQDQRLLLRLCWHCDVDHSGQVHDNLGIGCRVQAVFLARGPRDVGDVRGICEVHVQGTGFAAMVGGRGGEGGGDLPAFEGGGGVVWGVDDGGCGEVLLVFGLGLGGEEGRGEREEGEEREEAHFVEYTEYGELTSMYRVVMSIEWDAWSPEGARLVFILRTSKESSAFYGGLNQHYRQNSYLTSPPSIFQQTTC